jgi:hypothetical protein
MLVAEIVEVSRRIVIHSKQRYDKTYVSCASGL